VTWNFLGMSALRIRIRITVTLSREVYRQAIRLGAKSLETHDQVYFFSTEPLLSQPIYNTLCDDRMVLSFNIGADPRQRSHSRVRVPRN
jgi:hypothetical protein